MSITDLFAIGSSGTQAYRAALGAVSENISNATTDGYNRRQVILGEGVGSGASSLLYRSGVAFGGVQVNQVVRKTDDFLDLAARIAGGNFASADTRATWLENIQNSLNDNSLGVGQSLSTMFASATKLSANPTDPSLRTDFLYTVEQVNTAFHQTSSDLRTTQTGIATTAGNEVKALNDAAARLASVNDELRRAVPGSSNAAQLLDERDNALATITKEINVTVTYADNGTANVTYGGADVVANIVSKPFAVSMNATTGALDFTLDGAAAAAPTSGTLSGLASAATVVASRITAVDQLAAQYVTDMNTWHTGGETTAGVQGANILSGTDAASVQLLITDPTQIATQTTGGGATNGNMVAIENIRGSSGVENGWTAIISAHANLLAATQAEQTATSARNQQAQSARADVSGVDLDKEAADLLRLQQAYQGCARIIQVAKDSIQTILDIH